MFRILHRLSFSSLLSQSREEEAARIAARHHQLANADVSPPARPDVLSRPMSAARPTHGTEELLLEGEQLTKDPNWLPGLPLPMPGDYVEPPRNRSKSARTRYLSQLQSYRGSM